MKNRRCEDVLIAAVDALRGLPEATGWPWAIEAMFPNAQTRARVVHLIRNYLRYIVPYEYVAWKDPKALAAQLKSI